MSGTKIEKIKLALLFEKLNILYYKYEKLEKADSFNIFSILLKKHDEVNLHSRFIAEILSPQGSHNMGDKFLKAFIEQCEIEDFVIDKSTVLTEYRDIDVFIKSGDEKQGIIIENKIYASDQYKQLERYHEIIKGEGYKSILIFYLSLDGHEPKEDSVGELAKEKIKLLSYQVDILNWIERCIEISALMPLVRETLSQYFNLIKELTNQSYMEEHIKDLMELLGEGQNAYHAKTIADNWRHIRWHAEYNFWRDLENSLNVKYKILGDLKWSEWYLNSVIHYSRNRDPWYGIMFEILEVREYSFRCFIERGEEDLYYGLVLYKDNQRVKIHNEYENNFAQQIKEVCQNEVENFWLGWNVISPNINFQSFNSQALEIINPVKRSNFIHELVIEIDKFVVDCKNKLIVD